MKSRVFWLVPVIAAAGLAQTESGITREGRYWVQTVTGSLPLEGAARLRIATRGALDVQGEDRAGVAYTIKKRVRAGSEQQARRELERIRLKGGREGAWSALELEFPDRESTAEIRAVVNRSVRELAVESEGGAIRVRDLAGSVRADTAGGPVDMDRIEGELTIRTGGGGVRLGRIGKLATCVSGGGSIFAESLGGEARLDTGGGEIVVREARGPVRAITAGGNIRVERAHGGVIASSGGGLIDVTEAGGPVQAETGAGSINVRAAEGVRVESGAGSIRLVQVSGGLRAATGSGGIFAELSAAKPLKDSFLSASSGDVTVFIPSNLAVTVRALAESAGARKIVSEFSEIRVGSESRGAQAEAEGALNGGGPLLDVSVSGGTIYLRRRQ